MIIQRLQTLLFWSRFYIIKRFKILIQTFSTLYEGRHAYRCRFYGAEVDDSEDKRLVQRLVGWLTRRGYTAHSLVLFQRLNPDYWYGWPEDIFWQHRDADPFL